MAEVFSAEVTASIAKYAAEIAKIEGETSKSATKAAAALVAKMTAGQKAAGAAGVAAAHDAGDAWGASIALQAAALNKSIDAAKRDEAAWEAARAAEVAALNAVIDAQEDAARASNRLIDIAAQHGTAEDRLNRALEKTRAEIRALAATSGDAAQAQKALVAAESDHAAQLARLRGQHDDLDASVNTTKASYGNLFNQLADVGKGLAAGQSPITILTQQGEQLVFALQQAVPATGALVGGITALAVPASALTLAFGLTAAAVLDYADANAEAKRQSESLAAALTPLKDAIAAQQKQHDLLNAALASDKPAKYLAIAQVSADADAKEAEATKGLREEKEALMQQLADSADMDNFAGQLAQNRIKDIDEEIGLVHQQANEYARLVVENNVLTDAIEDMTDGRKKSTKATKEQTEAEKELNRAQIEEWKALDRRLDKEQEWREAMQANAERGTQAAHDRKQAEMDYYAWKEANALRIEQDMLDVQANLASQGRDIASVLDQLAAVGDEGPFGPKAIASLTKFVAGLDEADGILKQIQLGGALASELAGALSSVAQARADSAIEAARAAFDAVDAIHSQIADLQQEDIDAAELTGQALYDAYTTGQVAASDLSAAQRDALEQRLAAEEKTAQKQAEIERRAAMKAWKVQQGVAVATAGVLAIQAGLQGLVSAPYPLNLAFAAASLAAGLLQVKAIKSAEPPSFRRGGTAYPDERQVRATVEEGEVMQVTSRQGVAKARSDAYNAGMSPSTSPSSVTVNLVLDSRICGKVVEIALRDSPAARRAVTKVARAA